jgi:high affinity Mn2+ porin
MALRKLMTIQVSTIMILLASVLGACVSAQTQVAMDYAMPATGGAKVGPEPTEVQWQSQNWHMQSTIIGQGYPSLNAKYSGANSLPTAGQARETVSLDFYAGHRLWHGAEFHADLLTWQGFGLHGTLGVDDFTNGEAYKVGTRPPHVDIARFFIRQTIKLGGEKETVPSDQLTLAGNQDTERLTFTVGRYSVKDIFDINTYANDPRKQFMNWAFVANNAWDYPADSLGYTTGVSAELERPKWALRCCSM